MLLFGAAALLLAVTSVQVASVMFSDTLAQMREVGLRQALGASRTQVWALAATQSAVVAVTALGLALLIVRPITAFIVAMLPPELSNGQYLSPDLRTLVFGSALGVLGFSLLSLVPLGIAGCSSPLGLLGGRIRDRHVGMERTRHILLTVQMTLTALLLYLNGLAVHSFAAALTFDYGFDAKHVLAFTPPRPMFSARTTKAERDADQRLDDGFRQNIALSVERLRTADGVIAATNVFSGPLGIANQRGNVQIALLGGNSTGLVTEARENSVGVDFVRALGATLIAGHGFDHPEYIGRDDVVLVNETLARQLAPPIEVLGQNVSMPILGRHVRSPNGTAEVIGIIEDFFDRRLNIPADPQLLGVDRQAQASAAVLIRLESATEVPPNVRGTLEAIWGPLPPRHFAFLRDSLRPLVKPYGAQSSLLGLIALCCLPIAAIGLAGALIQSVRMRTREIAIRMAIGADPTALRRSLTLRPLTAVTLGTLFGSGLGIAVGYSISRQLLHVRPLDATTVIGVIIAILLIGWLSSIWPIRAALRVSPIDALRHI